MQNLRSKALEKSLFYAKEDLENFHIAVKIGDLVILSGRSGTGKSKLVETYADAIGAHFLLVPVEPSWNDNSDLIGKYDLEKNIYINDQNGLIDFLLEAEENRNELFIVCLDEMNLARVEHYFSRFLSILQTDKRELKLFNDKQQHCFNLKKGSITIGDNVRFVGTVNIDETTYHFSDKVLDRSNVVTLKILDFRKDWKEETIPYLDHHWSTEEINSLKNLRSIDFPIRELLWDLNTELIKRNFGFGPRVVLSIENYLKNRTPSLSFSTALDYQIKQRILTKLRGPEEAFVDLFENINKVFMQYRELSDFSMSRSYIDEKKNELEIYGFAQ